MDTSVKNLINMGPLKNHLIYYSLGDQQAYIAESIGSNYSFIAAPIAIFLLRQLSKQLNQSIGKVDSTLNLVVLTLISILLIGGVIFLIRYSRNRIKAETFKEIQLTRAHLKILKIKARITLIIKYIVIMIILFSAYRYLAFVDFQFLVMYMLGLCFITYINYDIQPRKRRELFKALWQEFN